MCSGIPIKLLNFSDLTKFLVLNFHAKHQIFNGLNTWLLGAVNKFSKNNRSIEGDKRLILQTKIKKWMTVYAVLLSCPVFEDSFKIFFNLK